MAVIDKKVLSRLWNLRKNLKVIEEIVDSYSTSIPVQIDRLRQAVVDSDSDAMRRQLHRMKGSALNLGAEQLADTLQQQQALVENDPGGYQAEFNRYIEVIESEFKDSEIALRDLLESWSKS